MPDFDLGTARGKVEIEVADPKGDLDKVNKSMESSLKSISDKMTKTGKSLTTGLTLPIVGFGAASVKAFTESERVAAQTAQVIKSTGGAANVSADDVSKLANSVLQYSGISDEAVASGENMILTFKGIKNGVGEGNDIFNQTTKAAADMATFMNKGAVPSADQMTQASLMLGKALNDPAEGLSKLTRNGVTFTAQQEKQIKAMVAAGDTMGAQKIILGELNSEFGGAAEAAGKTTSGAFAKMKENIGNSMEEIGKIIVEVGGPILQKLADGLKKVLDWFNALSPGTKKWIVTIAALVAAVGPAVLIIGKIAGAISGVIGAVKSVSAAFTALQANPAILLWSVIAAAVVALAIIIIKNWDKIKGFLLPIFNVIKAAAIAVWNAIKPVVIAVFNVIKTVVSTVMKVVGGIIKGVVWAIKGYWEVYKKAFLVVWDVVKGAVTVVIGIILALVKGFIEVAKAGFNAIKAVAIPVWNTIKAVIGAVIKFISAGIKAYIKVFTTAWDVAKKVVIGVWNGIKGTIGAVLGWIGDRLKPVIDFLIGAWNKIKEGAVKAWNGIWGIIKTVLNAFIDLWNNTIGWIAHGQKIGVGPLSVTMPDLRLDHLAKGTTDFAGGAAMVGEKGAELALFPRHTAVIPNHMLQAMVKGPPRALAGGAGLSGLGIGGQSLEGLALVGTATMDESGNIFVDGRIARHEEAKRKAGKGIGRMGNS